MVEFFPNFPPIHFGLGAIENIGSELVSRGIKRPLILTDRGLVKHGVMQKLLDALPDELEFSIFDNIPENPTIAGVEAALTVYREHRCDGIIGLGGGSVLDSGKGLRVIGKQKGKLIDYLKDPSTITSDVAPYITVPTTAGTGAELTSGGGIHPEENGAALGLRSVYIRPDIVFCDPNLTLSLPAHLTAATGMDAITHCVEGYLSIKENPLVEAIALDGISRAVKNIERAFRDGSDLDARSNMAIAALEGGMAIEMGLGPIHALSMAFGDSPLHHGTLVTVAMPAVMRFYNGLDGGKLDKISEAMGVPTGMDAGIHIADKVLQLNSIMGLPKTVREMGYKKNDIDRMVKDADRSWFNFTAPKRPSKDDYEIIVRDVLDGPR